MERRQFLKIASLASVSMLSNIPLNAAEKRPNILFIMSDDHSSEAIGAYGGRLAKLNPTPTIDKLASEGIICKNTFCNNSICSPSRASILTGQYSHINGVTSLGGRVAEKDQTLPVNLRQADYQTAIVGKWHLNTQPLAFDYYKVFKGQGKYHNPAFFERRSPDSKEAKLKETGYSSDLIYESSVKWLEQRDKRKSFALFYHFKAPHGPWDYHDRYASLYNDIDIPEPESLWDNEGHGSMATRGHNDELISQIGSSVGRRHRSRTQTKFLKKELARTGNQSIRDKLDDLSDDEIKRMSYQAYVKGYLRCVRGVDDNIKKMLDYLKSEGQLDNTIIIYTADQGMFLGEHDFIDKRWMYEESLRMPFIVRYPRAIKAGTTTDALINNTDFAPMMLEYAGVKKPKSMQGYSFRSILETRKEPPNWRTATYYRYWLHMAHHYNPAHFGIRTKEWKLIFFYGQPEKVQKQGKKKSPKSLITPPGWELYDMKNDPHERINLYGKSRYAKITRQLKRQLKDLRDDLGDSDEAYPHIKAVVERHWDDDLTESIRISNHLKNNAERLNSFEKSEEIKKLMK
ncbi:MAG: sulfatase [Candidatus Marinimicrobia bacterium]|jgi:arylsulfatase A-like enzyme|nr:sulfatase [Candidatus Neomarinimicrobiota bacterium]MBT3823588.1 sulfatase [Candidatus Neomarinimicrobiota bacterium]MBT4129553.1 sulfatase [Candidatus Neomarinimicrobiota bacterium]MBT4295921.1 sulfatase [Candidatus Neomarinimicrobiota bacterium]MBT4420077.1 sulfatase [Candidatus Neomarinimicrobiota bacterium]